MVEDGLEETLCYMRFPREHWRCLRTNNPLERLNREVRRRTRVVGAFPDGTLTESAKNSGHYRRSAAGAEMAKQNARACGGSGWEVALRVGPLAAGKRVGSQTGRIL
jgi:transposase-like protein